MEAATFRTAVADFHAVISTTLKGLRVVMGQEESEEEVLGAEYDSDGGEPIINLKTNHSTPQPFSDLVQGIAEISKIIRKQALAAARGASKADLETVKYLGDKLKEKEEQVAKLERENQDFHNARGRPPSHQNCAKEIAEIDRLENELKKALDAEAETRKQFEQANNYIDSVSRGRRVPELPDEVGGVQLRDETFDDLCKHFDGYHANARESLARVILIENMLRNAVINAGPASNKELEEEFKNQKAQADDAIRAKDAMARNLKGQLDQANKNVKQYRANSDALQLQVDDLTTQLDNSVKQFAILQKLETDAKRARTKVPDEAYRELETEKFKLLQEIEDLDTELMIRKEQLDEYRKIVVASDREIRRLKVTLAWDQDASRNRQEIQDLRERIVAYEHAIEDIVANNALEALQGSDALNPEDPDDKTGLDNLRLDLAKYEDKGQSNEEITNLRTEIASLDETIDSLKTELEEARAARPEEVDPALAQAHIDLDKRDNQIADLQRQIGVNSARHGQQVTDIQKRLDEARLNANGISPEDLRNLRKNLANCRKLHHEDQETIAILQGDLDACLQRGQLKDQRIQRFVQRNTDGSVDQLRELQDSMQEEIATLEAKLEKEREARDVLAEEARVRAEAERERDLKNAAADEAMTDESLASFDSNEEVNKEHIAKIRAQGTQMKQMQQEIHQLQYDISSSKAQFTSLGKQRDRLVTQLKQAREELANNQGGEGANADQLAEIAILEAHLADLETRLATCEQTGATLQLQRDQAITQNEEAIANMADLQIAHDIMAGEGPKLGLKRIKTRISNQAKATKARNIAAKEAAEEAKEAAVRGKIATAGERPPPPPKSPPGGGGGIAGPGLIGGGTGGAVGGGGGVKVGNQKEQEKEKEEEKEQPEPEGGTTSPHGRVTRSKAKGLEEKKAISTEEKKRLAAEDKQKKDAEAKKKKDAAVVNKEEKDDAAPKKKAAAAQKKKDDAVAKKEAAAEKKKNSVAAKKAAVQKKKDDAVAKKEKKADVAARQKRAAEKLKNKADAIAKKKKEKEKEDKKKRIAKEKKGKGGKGEDKKRKDDDDDDDDQPDAGTTGGGGSGSTAPRATKKKPSKESGKKGGSAAGTKGGSAAGTKRPGGDIVEPSSKRPKSDTVNATKQAKKESVKSIVTRSVATKASGSSSRPTREKDADWNELEEEEDEPLTPGGDEEDNALEEIIETVSTRAIFAAEAPQKSSFATHTPVVRPKVTFDKQKYVLEPEFQDMLTTLEVLNSIKRAHRHSRIRQRELRYEKYDVDWI
ncbi:hypothetical protein DID88_001581 [Monilinia fructigena]|uniref:Uncharacterized protein n=1 Tax=Monilinia fructigena TaxID=38457 RepID=A0A395IXV5_9HELO|nr:hypothetical protein DID88_001581 [Monilinia fructigena]